MGFSRQEYWSGLLCCPPGHLPDPGIQPGSPALQADSWPSEPPWKPVFLESCLKCSVLLCCLGPYHMCTKRTAASTLTSLPLAFFVSLQALCCFQIDVMQRFPDLKTYLLACSWWWSQSSNTLVTWYEELTQWKRPWCWGRLKAEGERGSRGWDGWMASPTQWTWIWETLGDCEGQGRSLACFSPRGHKELDMT